MTNPIPHDIHMIDPHGEILMLMGTGQYLEAAHRYAVVAADTTLSVETRAIAQACCATAYWKGGCETLARQIAERIDREALGERRWKMMREIREYAHRA